MALHQSLSFLNMGFTRRLLRSQTLYADFPPLRHKARFLLIVLILFFRLLFIYLIFDGQLNRTNQPPTKKKKKKKQKRRRFSNANKLIELMTQSMTKTGRLTCTLLISSSQQHRCILTWGAVSIKYELRT